MSVSQLFVSLEDLKNRMAIPADLDISDNLESALIAAQLRIEEFLDSQLDKKVHSTIFQLDSDSYSGIQPGGLFRLYLRTGFVRDTPALTVSVSGAWNGAYNPIAPTDYYIDKIRGILYVDAGKYKNQFIKADYTGGFEKASQLPDWLRESILAYAPVVLNFSQATNRNAEAEAGYKTSGDHALAVASPYLRNIGFVTRPLF